MAARQFVDAARTYVGARWRHRGRKPWALDCVGLVVLAAERSGQPVEDIRGYGREPWEDQLRQACRQHCGEPLAPSEAQLGDIALLCWNRGEPSHMGIIGDHPDGGLTLIHAHNRLGVVEQSLSGAVLKAVIEVYRFGDRL